MREQQAVICRLALGAHRLLGLLQLLLGRAVPLLLSALSEAVTDPDCGSSLFLPWRFASVLCRAWVRFSMPRTPPVSLLRECKKLPLPE